MKELKLVSSVTGIPESEIMGRSHKPEIAEARFLLYFLLRKKFTLEEVGKIMNRRHSTIHSGIKKIYGLISVNDRRVTGYFDLLLF